MAYGCKLTQSCIIATGSTDIFHSEHMYKGTLFYNSNAADATQLQKYQKIHAICLVLVCRWLHGAHFQKYLRCLHCMPLLLHSSCCSWSSRPLLHSQSHDCHVPLLFHLGRDCWFHPKSSNQEERSNMR